MVSSILNIFSFLCANVKLVSGLLNYILINVLCWRGYKVRLLFSDAAKMFHSNIASHHPYIVHCTVLVSFIVNIQSITGSNPQTFPNLVLCTNVNMYEHVVKHIKVTHIVCAVYM